MKRLLSELYLLPLPYHFDELLGIDHTVLLSSQRENTSRKNVEGGNLRLEHRKKHVLPGQGGAFKGWLCPAAQKGQDRTRNICGYAPTLTLEPRAAPDASTPSRSLLVHPAHGFAFYVANTLKVTFRAISWS
ncbi:hypothetical protein CK203_010459 [Vitis vinifera]|uniref:Uncharacterized protein n=1 Tax=Vitis vinifera TaxID=29760 RepID=A0A438JTV0_VITVI|nr:hypothetical protein CK203_010459 [Vitis vinifera]